MATFDVDVLVLGSELDGRSSLIARAATGKFTADERHTPTTTFPRTTINFPAQGVRCNITDTPAFSTDTAEMLSKQCQTTMAVFICQDVSGDLGADFSGAISLLNFANEAARPGTLFFLVLTKADACENVSVVREKARAFCGASDGKVADFFVTSAKTGEGIAEGMANLAAMVVQRAQAAGRGPQ